MNQHNKGGIRVSGDQFPGFMSLKKKHLLILNIKSRL